MPGRSSRSRGAEGPKILKRRITITGVLLATAITASLLAIDRTWVGFLIVFVLMQVVVGAILLAGARLRLFTANWLAPFFYSRGLFCVVRWMFGRGVSAWVLSNYATKLLADKRYIESEAAFKRVLDLDDQQANHWVNRGLVRYYLGRHKDTVTDLTSALDIESDHQVALTYRGYALMSLGEFVAALADLERVDCATTEQYTTAYYRGQLHEAAQNWKLAIENFLLANQLDASKTEAGIALARLQAGCPDAAFRDGNKAVENATTMCVRTNWSDWAAMSVLGAAYAEKGNFEKAVKYATMSLDLAPEDEKPDRLKRIDQFRQGQAFRIPTKEFLSEHQRVEQST